MVMDGLTRLYEQTVRLRADPEQLATIRWYWAPKDAKPFPRGHAFGCSGWETESRPYPHTGIGEVFLPRKIVPNTPPLGVTGQGTVTPLEWFSTGAPGWVDTPYPNGRCQVVCGVGWRPAGVQQGGGRVAAQIGAGLAPAALQQWFPSGLWRQRGLIAVGWSSRADQRGAGAQAGEVGVKWAALATSAGTGVQAGAVGAGQMPLSGQRQPGALFGSVAVGWGPQSATRATGRQVGAVAVGWAPLAPAVAALTGSGGAVADGSAVLLRGAVLTAAGGAVADGSAVLTRGAALRASGGAVAGGAAGHLARRGGGAVAGGAAGWAEVPHAWLTASGGAVAGGAAGWAEGPHAQFAGSGGAVADGSTVEYLDVPPTGTVLAYGAMTAPAGYLACDGAAVSRTTYSALFGVIGTVFGAGDGSTTFNVPDLLGRVVVGAGVGTGLTPRAPGDKGGEETHLLTVSELPSHSHGPPAGHGDFAEAAGPGTLAGGTIQPYRSMGTTGDTGGGGGHQNMPPYIAVRYIIKT